MADAVEIFIDISTPTGKAVYGLSDGRTFPIGPFYQGALIKFRIYPVVSTGSTINAPFYSKVDLTNLDFQLVLGPRAGAESLLATQYTWAKQTTADAEGKSGYFYADFNLNTTELNAAISTSDTFTSYLEFRLNRAGTGYSPVLQSAITIISVVKDPSGSSSTPTPTTSYLTRDECLNLFVMWNNTLATGGANNGRNILLVSPDGTHTRELGVGNDASPIDNAT